MAIELSFHVLTPANLALMSRDIRRSQRLCLNLAVLGGPEDPGTNTVGICITPQSFNPES